MARPANVDAAVTRERILDAALDLFAEKGFYGTTMRQIGAAAGITGGALYHHFDSKEAILLTLLERTKTLVLSRAPLQVMTGRLPPLPALFKRMTEGMLDVFDLPVHKKFFRIVMADGLRLMQQGTLTHAIPLEPRAAIAGLMQRLMDERRIRKTSVDSAALAFLGPLLAYRQFCMVWGVPFYERPMSRVAFVKGHVENLVRALSPR
ncbi:MAG: TetR/AcrR family transcriptional regulator [Deltaproteobacteria bacterium]|nr:TetR/AcrR family transcriptional regulator [Deltaproteobacteria bacterium]